MKEFIEKLIGRLEEERMNYFLTIANTGGEKMDIAYRYASNALNKAIEIVNELAEEYKPCNKLSCKDCEVYNKKKHYCPKWCDVIKHTAEELTKEHIN